MGLLSLVPLRKPRGSTLYKDEDNAIIQRYDYLSQGLSENKRDARRHINPAQPQLDLKLPYIPSY